jgi:acyl-CoA reductase-like NAD-dependent aldehyde dehydrogenase
MSDLIKAGMWLDGQEVNAETGETFPVFDPGRGEMIASVARGAQADVQVAVESASQAFIHPPGERLHTSRALAVEVKRRIEKSRTNSYASFPRER